MNFLANKNAHHRNRFDGGRVYLYDGYGIEVTFFSSAHHRKTG